VKYVWESLNLPNNLRGRVQREVPFPCRQMILRRRQASGIEGKSALAISRDLGLSYKAAFVLLHKLREAMAEEMKGRKIGGDGKHSINSYHSAFIPWTSADFGFLFFYGSDKKAYESRCHTNEKYYLFHLRWKMKKCQAQPFLLS
jgi:hypothetical protein